MEVLVRRCLPASLPAACHGSSSSSSSSSRRNLNDITESVDKDGGKDLDGCKLCHSHLRFQSDNMLVQLWSFLGVQEVWSAPWWIGRTLNC